MQRFAHSGDLSRISFFLVQIDADGEDQASVDKTQPRLATCELSQQSAAYVGDAFHARCDMARLVACVKPLESGAALPTVLHGDTALVRLAGSVKSPQIVEIRRQGRGQLALAFLDLREDLLRLF